MENAKELVEEFEREYGEEVKELRQQEQEEEEKEFSWELPRKFTAKLLYGWEEEDTKEREKRNRTKIGINGKIPQDKET